MTATPGPIGALDPAATPDPATTPGPTAAFRPPPTPGSETAEAPPRGPAAIRGRLDVQRLYVKPAAAALPRGQEVLARFPDAERIEVPSHWNIPGLHGNPGNVADWNRIKRTSLVVRYRYRWKATWLGQLQELIARRTPYLRVRYAF